MASSTQKRYRITSTRVREQLVGGQSVMLTKAWTKSRNRRASITTVREHLKWASRSVARSLDGSVHRSIDQLVGEQSVAGSCGQSDWSVPLFPPTLNDMHRDFTKQCRVTMKKHGTCEPSETLFLKTHQPTTKLGSRLASRLPISGCRLVVSWALLCRSFTKC